MLKILGRDNSINVRKVLWLCEELNLEYEREDWGRGFRSAQSPEYLQLNPNGQIPVVLDGDLVLWQSNSIIRYLANAYDKEHQLYPTQAKERFFVDQWIDWQAIELNNSWTYTIMSLLRHSPDHQDPNLLQQGIDDWNHHIQILDQQLEKLRPMLLVHNLAWPIFQLVCLYNAGRPLLLTIQRLSMSTNILNV